MECAALIRMCLQFFSVSRRRAATNPFPEITMEHLPRNVHLISFVIASLCIGYASGRDVLFTPASLRRIPLALIKARLSSRSRGLPADSSHIIYEVTSEGFLVGHNVNLNLLADTEPVTDEPQTSTKSYSLNGNAEIGTFPEAHVRQGKGLTVVYDSEHNAVVNAWGKDIFLEPLDQSSYPGVFINTHGASPLDQKNQFRIGHRTAMDRVVGGIFQNKTLRQSGSCRRVEVAVGFDNSFCAMFSNSEKKAMAYVQATMNYASSIYENDMCHSIILVHVDAHCQDPSDPYKALSQFGSLEPRERASFILNRFSTYWRENRASVHRDLAYFFSGFEEDTGTAGIASLSAACTSFGYGWVELGNGPVLVHELGHNLGAPHTSEGIMQPSIRRDQPVFFSAQSISQINTFLDSSRASCVDRAPAKCGPSCPGKCVNNRCIALYDDSTPSGLVPCILLDRMYKCTKSREVGGRTVHYGTDCQSGFEFLEPLSQKAAERYDVFCCRPPSKTSSEGVIPMTYPFVRLTIGSEVIPFYIRDPSDIQTGKLMDTELVPSCVSSGSTVPATTVSVTTVAVTTTDAATTKSKTMATTTTRAPATTEATTQARTTTLAPKTTRATMTTTSVTKTTETSVTTKSPTTASTTTSGGPSGSCGAALVAPITFVCSSVGRRLSIRDFGTLRLVLRQRSGAFQASLYARGSLRMTEIALQFSTNGKLGQSGFPDSRQLTGNDQSRVRVQQNIFELDVPPGGTQCCDSRIYLYLRLKVCLGARCTTGQGVISNPIRCGNPCSGEPDGMVKPFSNSQTCPVCQS